MLLALGACGRSQLYAPPPADAGVACVVGQPVDCETALLGSCKPGKATCILVNNKPQPSATCVAINQPQTEVCDGLDNDCDGQIDEGLRCPHPPVVTCGPEQEADANTIARVTGSASDPDGDAVTCQWSVVSRPDTATGEFGTAQSCDGSEYPADIVGRHQLRLTATDSTGRSASCETAVIVQPVGDLWIELTWDRANDVDLHLQHPSVGDPVASSHWAQPAGNNDCYWNNKSPEWDTPELDDNPSLDRDDEFNVGPENIRINTPTVKQSYRVGVHWFKTRQGSPVTATVRVYCAQTLVSEQKHTMGSVGEMWFVGSVEHGGTSCSFAPDGRTFFVQPVE
ncbi:MAG: putative metal-binding motif-containing protein [Myxococcaceae bacterium]|nr:putative metal-binding motif-containing protein [Myxococcaceae bacterium]